MDQVYLKDGSLLHGKILERGEEVLRFKMRNGSEVQIDVIEVQRLDQQIERNRPGRDPLAQGSLYHAFYFSGNLGRNVQDDTDWGMGIEHVTGLWLSDTYGVGLGTGLVQYSADYAWRIVPLVADLKIKTEKASLLLTADAGLGFPLRNTNRNIQGGKPGERFRIGVGKIWETRSNTHITCELSYLHQRAVLRSNTWIWWGDGGTTLRNMRFKRYQLRFGVLF